MATKDMDMAHRPRAARVALNSRAVVQSKERIINCRTLDLSVTGMAIKCRGALNVGLPVWVGFDLKEFPGWLALHAVVVRKHEVPDGAIWGLQFKGMDSTLVDCLNKYVQGHKSVFEDLPA